MGKRQLFCLHQGVSGGVKAAKAGHEVIMSPTSHCYFDYRQSLKYAPALMPMLSPDVLGDKFTGMMVFGAVWEALISIANVFPGVILRSDVKAVADAHLGHSTCVC